TFDPSTDFTYIIGVSGYTFGVVVRADAPWKTFQEFLADAKANPGQINYGTPGAGTSLHITMEQIAKRQGIKWTHVPFKGNAEVMNALLGGHIHAVADSSGWAQLVNAGQFRLLVTWGAARTKNWPSVPTLRDLGIDMVSNSPFGIAGPRGMEPKIVKTLHDAFKQGLDDPSYTAAMANLDQELFYMGSEDYQKFAMQQIEEARQFIAELGSSRIDRFSSSPAKSGGPVFNLLRSNGREQPMAARCPVYSGMTSHRRLPYSPACSRRGSGAGMTTGSAAAPSSPSNSTSWMRAPRFSIFSAEMRICRTSS